MEDLEFVHVPVLLDKVIECLNIKPDGVYVDCTMGAGGHSKEILDRLTTGKLIAFDRDEDAVRHCQYYLKDYADKLTIIKDNFKNAPTVLGSLGITNIDGVLIDLGISSYQIDASSRGFSYMKEGPLDMRMDASQQFSAFDVVNHYSEEKLTTILREYGEEQYAHRIAKAIVAQRAFGDIKTTADLVGLIDVTVPYVYKRRGHTAKKTFQAIRIEVNSELAGLEELCNTFIDMLNVGGRMAIIAFHSLEDKIIKDCFRENATDCICPKDFPICICSHRAKIEILTKKPIEADLDELKRNPRAASAKLRCAQRI